MTRLTNSEMRTCSHQGCILTAWDVFVKEVHKLLNLLASFYFSHCKTLWICRVDILDTAAVNTPLIILNTLIDIHRLTRNVPFSILLSLGNPPVKGTVAHSVDLAELMEMLLHISLKLLGIYVIDVEKGS